MVEKKRLANLTLIISLLVLVVAIQLILARKHLEFGFAIDIWNLLALYKEHINNPILDMPKAWIEIGAHNFAHTYYVGVLFSFFKYNYLYYNITHELLKALSALSVFPLIYLLFKNKFLAYLTTILYAAHFSTFGGLDDPARGADFLVIINMNLFLIFYIRASWKKNFNLKTNILLLIFLMIASFFDITRFYPFLLSLTLLEVLNFWLNRSSTNLKLSLSRLAFFYLPFLAIFFFSPHSILGPVLSYYKPLWEMIKSNNLQILLVPFASFGSTFVPPHISSMFGSPNYHYLGQFVFSRLFPMLIIFYPIYIILGFLISSSPKLFILRTICISIFFSFAAFLAANNWLQLDPKFQSPVDPGTFFIPALIGLFIFACAISFFVDYVYSSKKNPLLLGLSLSVFFSLSYIILTWILAPVNAIFMGVSAYLNIPAIGTSLFIAIIIYLINQKILSSNPNIPRRLFSSIILVTSLFILLKVSAQSIDETFSYWLKNGLRATEQERLRNAFWKEVGKDKKFSYQNPALFYLDTYQDYDNGYFYSTAFIWKISAYLFLETGQTLSNCDLIVINDELKKIKIKTINDKKVIIQNKCGYELTYKPENFYAFKLVNRNIYPNRAEILKQLGIE